MNFQVQKCSKTDQVFLIFKYFSTAYEQQLREGYVQCRNRNKDVALQDQNQASSVQVSNNFSARNFSEERKYCFIIIRGMIQKS